MEQNIPESEAWLYANPDALASVLEGRAQVRAHEFVDGPDLDEDHRLVDELSD